MENNKDLDFVETDIFVLDKETKIRLLQVGLKKEDYERMNIDEEYEDDVLETLREKFGGKFKNRSIYVKRKPMD